MTIKNPDSVPEISRRQFLRYSTGTVLGSTLGSFAFGGFARADQVPDYPIDSNVLTTVDRMIAFPKAVSPGLAKDALNQTTRYREFGYGEWTFGGGLPVIARTDLMPAGYSAPLPRKLSSLVNFFAFTDIHITDKEAPNQLLYFQGAEPNAYGNTSIYSPVMPYTTQVLDAAIQTINALHKSRAFDFGISLGDTCNSTQYNELRWYLDVIDGKLITPSSGAHLGAENIDYQTPYKAAGLDKTIPWYQVLGNHDHFMIGSFPVDADPALGFRQSYIADTVWAVGNGLIPDFTKFPQLFNMRNLRNPANPSFYAGVIDGASPYGSVIYSGQSTLPAFATGAPGIAADAGRRSLTRKEWVAEFFKTTTGPVGHGFHLVNNGNSDRDDDGFACYSFVPNPAVPLKIIVLDDTQSEYDGSNDIHGHGYLDKRRWAWLQDELAQGQAANQLMIVAAHIPIGVSAIGEETEWWLGDRDTRPGFENAVDLTELIRTLQANPNLLLWACGHRHLNVVKAFASPDPNHPELGFWQVETSSLRDFPQQFRTFEIILNSDYTVSIRAINVDPAVVAETPAAKSRRAAIAAQQIIQTDLQHNNPNRATIPALGIKLPTMDPTRPQSDDPKATDPSIRFVDLSQANPAVPYNASYNAELYKQLSPEMVAFLKARFPVRA